MTHTLSLAELDNKKLSKFILIIENNKLKKENGYLLKISKN